MYENDFKNEIKYIIRHPIHGRGFAVVCPNCETVIEMMIFGDENYKRFNYCPVCGEQLTKEVKIIKNRHIDMK